jgi:hypothetical protein
VGKGLWRTGWIGCRSLLSGEFGLGMVVHRLVSDMIGMMGLSALFSLLSRSGGVLHTHRNGLGPGWGWSGIFGASDWVLCSAFCIFLGCLCVLSVHVGMKTDCLLLNVHQQSKQLGKEHSMDWSMHLPNFHIYIIIQREIPTSKEK